MIFRNLATAIIGTLLLLSCGRGWTQWKVHGYQSYAVPVYNFLTDSLIPVRPFCFPQTRLCRSIVINRDASTPLPPLPVPDYFDQDTKSSIRGAGYTLQKNINADHQKAQIHFSIYSMNVKKVLLVLSNTSGGQWWAREFPVNGNGFHIPQSSFLAGWDTETIPEELPGKMITIRELSVFYQPVQPALPSELAIGDLRLEEQNTLAQGAAPPWIDSLAGNKQYNSNDVFDRFSSWSLTRLQQADNEAVPALPSFGEFAHETGFKSVVTNFIAPAPGSNEKEMISKFLNRAIALYPCYRERNLDRDSVSNAITAVCNNQYKTQYDFYYALKEVIKNGFGDPHFEVLIPDSLNHTQSRLMQGPVRLKNIGGNIVVVAVFSEAYKDAIPLGCRITAIDGNPVDQYLHTDIAAALYKTANDTLQLTYILPGKPDSIKRITVLYNKPVTVGNNFRLLPEGPEFIQDSLVYLRIKNWEGNNFYRLLNSREKIRRSKGLIIDLRGNGGGYSAEVFQALSLFVDKPESIGYLEYPWFSESLLVFPNHPQFRLPADMPVCILTDGGTACASEIFITGMKRRKNTLVAGDSRTMGAVASPLLYRFPSGLIIRMHTNIGKYRLDSRYFREGYGIEPDIWVSRTHARDLAPYQDKVLKEAILVLKLYR